MSGTVVSHGVGNLARGVGVVGHARGATGLGHRVGKGVRARSGGGCGLGLVGVGSVAVSGVGVNLGLVGVGFGIARCVVRSIGRHAQGTVEVLERKVDLAKVHVAGRVIGCGRALGHRDARLVGGHGKGELARDVCRGQALGSLELLGASERGIDGFGAIDILEHRPGATVVRLCRQGTVAVVDDDDLKAKARLRGGNTLCCERGRVLKRRVVDGPRKLAVRVGADGAPGAYQVGEHLGVVMQRAKAHLAVIVERRRATDGFRLARIGDAKVELTVGQRTTGQGLGGNDLGNGTTRCIGRGAIAVDERDHGALDRSDTSLVLSYQRSLVGVASNDRRSGERTSAIVGDSDRHGALGVVVGVTELVVVLLGNGVCKGLTRVSLRKLDLMAGQNINQTDRRLCRCRGLEVVGALMQAKCIGRSRIGRRHGKGELALSHGTSVEALAELEAAGRGVIELSAVRVGKASVFLLGDVGGQVALAVFSHSHLGGRDMGVVRHARRVARVLADLVLIGSGSRVADLAEVDGGDAVLRVLLAHAHGCGVGQRGALGGGNGKAELVGVRPSATIDSLAQAKVELCIERGHAISVLEGRSRGVLQDMLGLECAVAVIGDGRHDGELGITVFDALAGGSAVGLAQRVGVRSGLVVLHGAHRNRAVGGVLAGGDDLVALDELEGELAFLEVAPGQDLVRLDLVGDAELVRIRLVAVVELRLVGALQDMLRHERAVALVGDGGLDGVGLTIVGDTVAFGALGFAQDIGVLAGGGVGDLAHRNLAIGVVSAGGDDLAVLDELEGELAFLEVAPGQDLGRGDLVSDARLNRRHVIGVGERKGCVTIRLAGHPQIALAVISHGEGNLARQLGVVGHAGDLAGLGHGVGKGVLTLLRLLAQGLVKVIERKGNLAKVDLALVIIGHARVRGHGCALFTGHGKGELAGNVSRGQAIRNLQILLAHKRRLGRRGSVGVHKLVAGIAVDSRRRQGTIAVVDNGYICVNCRHGSAHARGQLTGLLGSDVMNGPRGFV